MAISRKEEFSDNDLKLAEWCKAMAHPARIAILKNLARQGECICGDLVLDLPLAQSTVSQHLKALKEAKLIKGEIDGPRSKYCIDKKNFDKFMNAIGDFGFKISTNINDQNC
jgi:ArsR family transcriptional regulator